MNSSISSCSEDNNANEEATADKVAELLAAAWENRVNKVLRILEADPELIRMGDQVGDTALHVLARSGHVDALRQMIGLLQNKHQELLTSVAKQGNGQGNTPLHLALKNKHSEAAFLLLKAEPNVSYILNEDGEFPEDLAKEAGDMDLFFKFFEQPLWPLAEQEQLLDMDNTLESIEDKDKDKLLVGGYEKLLTAMCQRNFYTLRNESIFADLEMDLVRRTDEDDILEMLEADLNLIQVKNQMGNTIFHEVAVSSDNIDTLTKLIGKLMTTTTPISSSNSHDDHLQLPRLSLLLEGNKNGDTALHLALFMRYTKVARYLIEVAPEAAYLVNHKGFSPLCVALNCLHYDLVKYVLRVMPEASIPPAIRHTMLISKEGSLPHTAIRARNLTMLETIMESLPCLIDSLDEKGWKPLSYAAYKGYLEEVVYLTSSQNL